MKRAQGVISLIGVLVILMTTTSLYAEVTQKRKIRSDIAKEEFETHGFGFAAQMGLLDLLTPGTGAELFYNYKNKFQLGLQGMYGKSNFSYFSESFENYLELGFVQLNARSFLTRSFNIVTSLGYREVAWGYLMRLDTEDERARGRVQSMIASLGISNIWRFKKGFYIGGDWVSFAYPLYSKVSDSVEYAESCYDEDGWAERYNDTMVSAYSKAGTLQLAVIGLGWVF